MKIWISHSQQLSNNHYQYMPKFNFRISHVEQAPNSTKPTSRISLRSQISGQVVGWNSPINCDTYISTDNTNLVVVATRRSINKEQRLMSRRWVTEKPRKRSFQFTRSLRVSSPRLYTIIVLCVTFYDPAPFAVSTCCSLSLSLNPLSLSLSRALFLFASFMQY